MKRSPAQSGTTDSEQGEKRSRRPSLMEELEGSQAAIDAVDRDCCRDLIRVQRRFDSQKRPLYEARALLLRRIPNFWLQVFTGHPLVLVTEVEFRAFQYLADFTVDDNIDDLGSYRVSLTFSSGNPMFPERELLKKVKFNKLEQPYDDDDASESLSVTIEARTVSWTKEALSLMKSSSSEQSDSEDGDELMGVLAWMTDKNASSESMEMGDVLRRDVWTGPLNYFVLQSEKSMNSS
ncbi:hypothetical protein FOZ61_009226 [Perkinsus olseni]|uniref:Protein SET n=1 Tax=Perkinsus olseni TaxID=32597 RepID=A0A7J6M5G1_PEROL|nr:hypothetical protein FOZ61_009226 [Perkinsus olseni]